MSFKGTLNNVKYYCGSCETCQLRARQRRSDNVPMVSMVLNTAVVFLFVVRLRLVFSSLHHTTIVNKSHIFTKAVGNKSDEF